MSMTDPPRSPGNGTDSTPGPVGLLLPPWVMEDILPPLRAAWPEEGCGLLIGRDGPDGWLIVDEAEPTANVADPAHRAGRFEVDPAARVALERRLRGSPLRIVGHYHSHPGHPPAPSETDRGQAYEPDLIWLLIGLQSANDPGPVVAAWAVAGWTEEGGAAGFRWLPVREEPPG